MLDQHDVSQYEARAGDSGELIVGEIPRFNRENNANGIAFYDCLAFIDREVLRS